jgi:hypothetical protein
MLAQALILSESFWDFGVSPMAVMKFGEWPD